MNTFKKYISTLIVIAFLLTGISVFNTKSVDAAKSNPNREKTEILIKYKDEKKISAIGKTIKSKIKLSKFNLKKKNKKMKLELIEIGDTDSIDKVIKELKKDSNIQYVTPNYLLHAKALPSDEYFADQWGLSNKGQTIGSVDGRSGVDINVLPVWDTTTGSKSVTIGLLDTGVDYNHPDLAGAIDLTNAKDFVNGDNEVFDSAADDAHGTQIAGIIAGQANTIGVRGIAPGVKILPLKFMSGSTGYTSDAIDAINYAVEKGVKIVNCSFGCTDNNPALKDAMSNSGILFICAAGNEGESEVPYKIYPAAYELDNIISVGAIDNSGVLASFSSRGTTVDVAAPGVKILTTNPENTYEYIDGTSAAAAHVTGIAGLLKSVEPDISNAYIKTRILSNVKVSNSLEGKVYTNGRVDANAVITNMPASAETDGLVDDSQVIEPIDSTQAEGGIQETLDETIQITEMLHYGENGVFPGSQNFSFTCSDMSMDIPGFDLGIKRTYNAKGYPGNFKVNDLLGKGWRFSFDCKMIVWDTDIYVILPNGKTETFNKNKNGSFSSPYSRDRLTKTNVDILGEKIIYTLTTPDQFKYEFDAKYGHGTFMLNRIKDKNGNTITINYLANDSTRVDSITDFAGRKYTIGYNPDSDAFTNLYGYRIKTITDSIGRVVTYDYDNKGKLIKVTDAEGNIMKYEYNKYWYLIKIKDGNDNILLKITYGLEDGSTFDEVQSVEDCYGNKYTYSSSRNSNGAYGVIRDKDGRTWKYYYDKYLNQTKVIDSDGKYIKADYAAGTAAKCGEPKTQTDKNGNVTQFTERDSLGNIKKIVNPDSSIKILDYDSKGNLIYEKDEAGKCTYYIYDAQQVNLLKKVQPLNGTDVYSATADQNKYAITTYTYYADGENGYLRKGLLKSVVDPVGNSTTYTYDLYGNLKTETDSLGRVKSYEYNQIGWKTAEITPLNKRTEYAYDLNGLLEKILQPDEGVSRVIYDSLGRKVKEIAPKQYTSNDDRITAHSYIGDVGTRTEYYKTTKTEVVNNTTNTYTYISSKPSLVTDAENNKTSYMYDIYGNLKTETKPNGAIYTYYYDLADRIVKKTIKDNSSGSEEILEEYFYNILSNKNTTKKVRKYISSTTYTDTVFTYDYAERLVEQLNPDGNIISYAYNPNGTLASKTETDGATTYYKYDGMNRLSETWTPFELVNGVIKYSYTKTEYYKDGKKKAEYAGKETVAKDAVPTTFITKNYYYYADGNLQKETDSSGAETTYEYDADGFLSKQTEKVSSTANRITEFVNNYLGKPLENKEHVKAGDLFGNDFTNNSDQVITTTYTYDKNGNLETEIDPYGVTTTNEYDNLNRLLSVTKPGIDENNAPADIRNSYTYNWEGKKLTETDSKSHTTSYEYNQKGYLAKKTDAKNGVYAYEYDLAGRLISEVSPKNYIDGQQISQMNHTEYIYDNMDRVKTRIEKYINPQTGLPVEIVAKAYKYDKKGNIIKELDGCGYNAGAGSLDEKINSGYGTEYTYNYAGKVTKTLDAESKAKNLTYLENKTYDALGREKTKTNAKGVVTTYYYDDGGRLKNTTIKETYASNEISIGSANYDLTGNKISEKDGNGNITSYEYNYFGKVRKVVEPGDETILSNATTYQYDLVGNLKKQVDLTGKVNLFSYDNQDRILTSTEQDSSGENSITVTYRYDKNGNKAYEQDGNGNITTNTYDELNRLQTVKDAKGHTTIYDYDPNGNQTTVTDWIGNVSTNIYDPLNKLIEKKDQNNKTIQKLNYYENGLQHYSYDALNAMTEYIYDKNGRLTDTIDPLGHKKSQTYDWVGNIETKTDGENNKTTFKYNQYNGLTDIISASLEKTSYTYDINGNMLTQKDGKGNISYYFYNVADKLIKRVDAGGMLSATTSKPEKTEIYTYYADGNMAEKIDRNGKKTNYTYDVHGKLKNEAVGNISIDYTYDNNGNQLTMKDSTGTTERQYDELNRTVVKIVPNIGTTNYEYDIIDGVEAGYTADKTTDPKLNVVLKVYDKTGRLVRVISDGKTATYEYYDNGSKKKVTYSNGASEEYTYFDDNLLKILVNKKADGSTAETFSYTYDGAHNLKTKTDVKGLTSYDYDDLNRLKTVKEQNETKITGYLFDSAGNRTTEKVTQDGKTAITTYDYNEQNRLMKTVETKPDGEIATTIYTYDNNGNLLREVKEQIKDEDPLAIASMSVTVAGEEQVGDSYVSIYEYDELNQLVKSQTGNKQVINSYNGEGTRVAKEVNGDITRFLYEGINVILETNGTGSEKAHNVHGTNLLSRTAAGQTADYFYNGHGDVTLLLSEDGQQLASYYYDAFGNPESVQESVYNPYRYAGYMWDDETGKYYLMARMYDPIIARFMQEDSYRGDKNDPLSLNLYTYCHNEPMMYSDPDGHDNVYAQINNKKIENADSYKTGVYGNLRDMVTGLGGSITWNSKTSTATVKMWNKEENKNYVIKYDAKDKKNGEYGVAKRYEVDAKGKLTYVDSSNFFMKDGNIQAGMWNVTNFAGYADKIEFGKNKGTTNVLLNTKATENRKDLNKGKNNTSQENKFSWSELGNKASKIVILNTGVGFGLGVDDLSIGPVKGSAGVFAIEELLSYEKGKASTNSKVSADIGIDVKKLASIGAEVERKVDYADNNDSRVGVQLNPKAQNSWKAGVTFLDNKNLAVENPGRDNDYKFTIGGTAGLLIAVELEVGVNVNMFADTMKYIFTSKK